MKNKLQKKASIIPAAAAILFLSSCGTAPVGDQKETAGGQAGKANDKTTSETGTGDINAPLVQQDEVVLGESINSQVEEAISSAVEELESGSGTSLALTEDGFYLDKGIGGNGSAKEKEVKNDMTRFRDCVEEGNKAVVTLKHSISHERSFERKKLKGSTKSLFLLERTRTWSKEGTPVKCATNKKTANIAWADLKGYELAVKLNGEKSREQSLTNLANNTTMTQSHYRSQTGTRSVKWLEVTKDAEKITLDKQVSSSTERKMKATNKKGESKSWESSVKTAEGAPLMITVVRNAKTNALVTRTIKSGSIVGIAKDGTKVETKFENVVYEKASKCNAISGKLSGAIYAKDAQTPSVTYTVSFNGDEPTVEFSDGKSYDLSIDGCEFEEEDSKITEATKKEDVKDPIEKK